MQADVQVLTAGAVDLAKLNTPSAMTRHPLRVTLGLAIIAALLGGCEQLGIPDPAKTAVQAEADGKAVGSACRHAGRAIEDCFTLNPSAPRAAVFAGWKDMNDYMAEKEITEVVPQLPPPSPPGTKPAAKAKHGKADSDTDAAAADKSEAAADSHATPAETAPTEERPRKRRRSATAE